jgi:hypothetical protein
MEFSLGSVFMELGMYIMAPEPISLAYFINASQQPVCLYAHPSIVARKWIGKKVTRIVNLLCVFRVRSSLVACPFSTAVDRH